MAGTFADVPGVRIPYHLDGSLVRWAGTVSNSNKALNSGWTDLSAADVAEMNDGDITDLAPPFGVVGSAAGRYICWVFPQAVTIVGHNFLINAVGNNADYSTMEYSTNTTDGGDGTWSTSSSVVSMAVGSALRDITAVNWTNVKAIRLHFSSSGGTNATYTIRDIAFYGTWTPATLAGWHATLDQQAAANLLDFGDAALGSSTVKQFRIKNGRSLQANNVVVSAAAGNTQTAGGMAVSLDGSTYTGSVNIASIAAGAISPVVYVRRNVATSETIGNIGIAYVQFIATTWT